MPTPDRRPRGHNRRARQGRRAPTEGSLLQRIQSMTQRWRAPRQTPPASPPAGLWRGRLSLLGGSPLPRRHTLVLALLLPIWLIAIAWQPSDELQTQVSAPSGSLAVPIAVPVEAAQTENGQAVKPKPKPQETLPPGWNWLTHEIDTGDTLFSLFRKFQLPGVELSRLVAIEGPDRPLTRLPAGKTLGILLNADRRIQRVEIRERDSAVYRYERSNEGFVQKEIPAS